MEILTEEYFILRGKGYREKAIYTEKREGRKVGGG